MSAYDDWAKTREPQFSYEMALQEAFNAGMTRAAEICNEITGNEPSGASGRFGSIDCKEAILKARDGV